MKEYRYNKHLQWGILCLIGEERTDDIYALVHAEEGLYYKKEEVDAEFESLRGSKKSLELENMLANDSLSKVIKELCEAKE